MKKHFVVALTIMVAVIFVSGNAFAGSCTASKEAKAACSASAEKASAKAIPAENSQLVTFAVSNLTCNGCVSHLTKVLTEVEGVGEIKVSLKDGTAVVEYDKTTKVEPSMLATVITEAGYPAKLADDKSTDAKGKAACDPTKCATMKNCDPAACGGKK